MSAHVSLPSGPVYATHAASGLVFQVGDP
ncbi:hypothetical protein EYZ11_010894 [Aspergillus tanneri]|uniref:Uncharacterized protein n=1 Tax=Aspergillus tanneri TaxID=1220188 RepID=A0A4S3J459_9EURO|nr:hypothetical protein EYZ11_010894 [Aspergillus tanneri]